MKNNIRKCLAGLIILVFLFPLFTPAAVDAYDLTHAVYVGNISVTNNSSTAKTNVIATITLDPVTLKDVYDIDNSWSFTAIVASSGAAATFMPSNNSTNKWCLYIPTIAAHQTINYSLYIGDDNLSCDKSYFPASGGMSVNDIGMLEPGNNCEFDFTNALVISTAYNIVFKPGAFVLSNDGSGNVTVATANYSQLQYTSASSQYCHKDAGVVSPSGSAMSIDAWAKRATAGAQQFVWNNGVVGSASSWYLIFTAGDKIQLVGTNDVGGTAVSWVSTNSTVALTQYFITATYDNTRTPKTIVYVNGNLWGGADGGVGGAISQPTTFTGIGAGYNGAWLSFMNGTIDEVRISNITRTATEHTAAYNSGVGNAFILDTNTVSLWHFSESTGATTADAKGNNNLALVNNPTWDNGSPVTYHILTAISGFSYGTMISGFFKQDGVKAWLTINGVSSANVSAYPISDNTSNWVWMAGAPFIGTMKEYVGGILKGSWAWQYATTFTDLSGNGNTGTPTFRITGTDGEVTALLVSFEPITLANPPPFDVATAPAFITDNSTMEGQFATGNVSATGGPPGFSFISEIADAGKVPNIWLFGMIAFSISAGGNFFWVWMQRRYGFRSMWPIFLTGATVMGLFIALGGTIKVFDFWMIFFYILIFICLMVMSRHTEVGGNVSTHGLIGFAAQSWIGLTVINRMLEGAFVGASETAWVNSFAFTQTFKIFGLFTIPVLNTDFWTKGIPSLIRWDYSFFGGNAMMFQYLLYVLTAVLAFVLFGLLIGLLYNFFK